MMAWETKISRTFSAMIHQAGIWLCFLARTMEKKAIFLVCQKNLIDYYVKFGYEYSKLSPLVYGGQTWHEMKFTL